MEPFRPIVIAAAFGLLAATSPSQGFTAGDLYLHSTAITGISSSGGGIVRIDPTTGTSSLFLDLNFAQQWQDSMAFDAHRGGLVFHGTINGSTTPKQFWFVDAVGNLQSLGFQNGTFHALAPTGDGRIYLRDRNRPTGQVHWLDAGNQQHTLLDATGTQPFTFTNPGFLFHFLVMEYDPATNSLIAAAQVGAETCAGTGPSPSVVVRRVTLSPDGTQAVGPVACTEVEVSTSGEVPVGLSRMPNGSMLLVVDTNSNATEPRMIEVDPVTMTTTTFASNGHFAAAATNAGCWSSALGKAVILDTGNDVLRAFSQGQTGDGAIITTSSAISSGGSSGEVASLIEVGATSCAGSWTSYGAGKFGTGQIIPSITGTGCPTPGNTIHLNVSRGVGGGNTAILVGLAPLSLPFLGGTVLVDPLFSVSFILGGTSGAAGDGSVSVPIPIPSSFMPGDPNPYYIQAVILDLGATQDLSMTGGLEMDIG